MSYLKLDRTRINYLSPNITRGGIILSQVIDSEMGPESPKLISSTSELDLYFGRTFKDRGYFEELLSEDVTFLLTNPSKPEDQEIPIIDISEYKIINEIEEIYKDGSGSEETYKVPLQYSDQLPKIGEEKTKYYVSEEDEYYVYFYDEWTRASDLPTKRDPGSLANRDALRLTYRGWTNDGEWGEENKLSWCWPKYSSKEWTPEYNENLEGKRKSLLNSLKFNFPIDSEKSIGFILDFSEIEDRIKPREDTEWTYLVVPVSDDKRIQFYVGSPLNPDILGAFKDILIPDLPIQDQAQEIINKLKEYDWECIQIDSKGLKWELYNKDIFPDTQFYNIPGLKFYGDQRLTHNILSILSEKTKRMEFFSKTIGKGDEDIRVEITKTKEKTEWYRIIISRYNYQEVYEGPLYLEVDEETDQFISLEKEINQRSLLVTVVVYNNGYSKSNPSDGLPTGIFTLSRAIPQSSWTQEDYWRGLSKLEEFGVSEDFLMIPQMEEYIKIGVRPEKSWYSEYEDLLKYATLKNCQVLISNNLMFGCERGMNPGETIDSRPPIPEKNYMYFIKSEDWIVSESWDGESWITWGSSNPENLGRWTEIIETFKNGKNIGNQEFNYNDLENRLIYFFQDMTYHGWERPGWYVFLRGILSGVYSIETNEIIYNSPVGYYEEDKNSELEKHKSNFLSYNGHIYYYQKFFSHPGDWKYTNTILSRFCLDKVANTITREFPAYLAKETTGEILRGLKNLLSELKSRYPIIHSLDLDRIEEDPYKQTLSVYLNLGIREILDKDVKLSVTLNFNSI